MIQSMFESDRGQSVLSLHDLILCLVGSNVGFFTFVGPHGVFDLKGQRLFGFGDAVEFLDLNLHHGLRTSLDGLVGYRKDALDVDNGFDRKSGNVLDHFGRDALLVVLKTHSLHGEHGRPEDYKDALSDATRGLQEATDQDGIVGQDGRQMVDGVPLSVRVVLGLDHGSVSERVFGRRGQFFRLGPFSGFSFGSLSFLFGFLGSLGRGFGGSFFSVLLGRLLVATTVVVVGFLFGLLGRRSVVFARRFLELNLEGQHFLQERIPFFLGFLFRLGLLDFLTQGGDLRRQFFFCRHGSSVV
mmetsp:Transcript_810/g.1487  ORF Transcript_810/g.1487 Transcript_810/m.1487 type:complete len:299 (+) Transcript_810:299-1195(+)